MKAVTIYLHLFLAMEYAVAPAIATPEPIIPSGDTGVRKTTTEAKMMTTRLTVLVTACVTGATSLSAKNATSLYR